MTRNQTPPYRFNDDLAWRVRIGQDVAENNTTTEGIKHVSANGHHCDRCASMSVGQPHVS